MSPDTVDAECAPPAPSAPAPSAPAAQPGGNRAQRRAAESKKRQARRKHGKFVTPKGDEQVASECEFDESDESDERDESSPPEQAASDTPDECEQQAEKATRRRVNLAWRMLREPHLAYSIPELVEIGPVSRPILYREIADGKLVARKLRGRTVILASDWEDYLRALPRLQPGSEPPALRRARGRPRKVRTEPAAAAAAASAPAAPTQSAEASSADCSCVDVTASRIA